MAQVLREKGPPEVMQWREWPVADPEYGEVRIRHTAIGVNFADTYHRGGVSHPWPVPDGPCVIGFEAAGIVEGAGAGVSGFQTGGTSGVILSSMKPITFQVSKNVMPTGAVTRIPARK